MTKKNPVPNEADGARTRNHPIDSLAKPRKRKPVSSGATQENDAHKPSCQTAGVQPEPDSKTTHLAPKGAPDWSGDHDSVARSFLVALGKDFFFFVRQCWEELPTIKHHHPLGEIEEDVCLWVQTGPRKRGVLAPRKFGKSHLVSIAYALWRLYQDPNHKVMVVSKSLPEARKVIRTAREWIDSIWFLRHLAPDTAAGCSDSADQFDCQGADPSTFKNPSFVVKGIGGQITGTHAHTLIADDIEDEENTKTAAARDLLFERTREFNNIVWDSEGCEIIYVGTFHHEESTYIRLSEHGVSFRTWPILYPKPAWKLIGLAPMLQHRLDTGAAFPDDLVFPYRTEGTRRAVVEKQAEGERNFAMQQMLRADVRDAIRYPLRLADLIVYDFAPNTGPQEIAWGKFHNGVSTAIEDTEIPSLGFSGDRLHRPVWVSPPKDWRPFHQTALWIDPAGSGNDRTGVAVASSLNGYIFVHEVLGLSGGACEANITRIAELAHQYRATTAYIEGNLSGSRDANSNPWAQLIQVAINTIAGQQPKTSTPWGCRTEVRWSSGQKELRIINALQPILASHRLVLSTLAASNQDLQTQLTRLTTDRNCLDHEDELESLSAVARELNQTLSIDPVSAKRLDSDLVAAFEKQLNSLIPATIPEQTASWIAYN